MKRTIALVAGVLCAAVPGLFGSQSPAVQKAKPRAQLQIPLFSPYWLPGDSWKVRYTFPVQRELKTVDTPKPTLEDFVYTYTVQQDTQDPLFPNLEIRKILAQSQDGYPDWLLTFDAQLIVLLSVEQVVDGSENIRHENPFGNQSWMAELNEFGRPEQIPADPVERMLLGAWSQIILAETTDYCIAHMLLRGARYRLKNLDVFLGHDPDDRVKDFIGTALGHIEPLSSIVVTIAPKPTAGTPQGATQ